MQLAASPELHPSSKQAAATAAATAAAALQWQLLLVRLKHLACLSASCCLHIFTCSSSTPQHLHTTLLGEIRQPALPPPRLCELLLLLLLHETAAAAATSLARQTEGPNRRGPKKPLSLCVMTTAVAAHALHTLQLQVSVHLKSWCTY